MAVADRCKSCKGPLTSVPWILPAPPRGTVRMMVGRDVRLLSTRPASRARPSWKWTAWSCPARRTRTTPSAASGSKVNTEIVCVAGIENSSQTELIYGLTGLEKVTGGTVGSAARTYPRPHRRRSKDMSHIGGPPQAWPAGAGLHRSRQHGIAALLAARSSRTTASSKSAVMDYAERLIKLVRRAL